METSEFLDFLDNTYKIDADFLFRHDGKDRSLVQMPLYDPEVTLTPPPKTLNEFYTVYFPRGVDENIVKT